MKIYSGVSLGQDIAEILGVLGILPIHPQTNLRLKKVHETRANMPIHETPYMMGEVCSIEAAKKRLKMEDIKDYTDRDGIEALLTGECKFFRKNRNSTFRPSGYSREESCKGQTIKGEGPG